MKVMHRRLCFKADVVLLRNIKVFVIKGFREIIC